MKIHTEDSRVQPVHESLGPWSDQWDERTKYPYAYGLGNVVEVQEFLMRTGDHYSLLEEE